MMISQRKFLKVWRSKSKDQMHTPTPLFVRHWRYHKSRVLFATLTTKAVSGTIVNLDEFHFTAGEFIKGGSLVYIGSDGRAYAVKEPKIIEGEATKSDKPYYLKAGE